MRRVLVVAVCVLASRNAHAVDPDLGARGQVVVTDNVGGVAGWRGYDTSGARFTVARISPSVDYFVARNVSIGLDANAEYDGSHAYNALSRIVDTSSTYTSIGLRVGVNVPLGRWLSIWPRGTAYFRWAQTTIGANIFEQTTSSTAMPELTLFVALVMHVRSHLFVGVGPAYSHEFVFALSPSGPTTERNFVTIGTFFGGYLGGEKTAKTDEPRVEWRRFGAEHQVAFDGDVSASWNGSSSGGSNQWSARISVGADYFVFENFSAGLAIATSYTRGEFGASGTEEIWDVSLAPRLGVNVPISSRFSFYPRAQLGFGASGFDLRDGAARNAVTSLIVYASAYAPILFHLAPHYFIGLGPTIYRELVDKDPSTTFQPNNATAVGAALTVGAWL